MVVKIPWAKVRETSNNSSEAELGEAERPQAGTSEAEVTPLLRDEIPSSIPTSNLSSTTTSRKRRCDDRDCSETKSEIELESSKKEKMLLHPLKLVRINREYKVEHNKKKNGDDVLKAKELQENEMGEFSSMLLVVFSACGGIRTGNT